MKAEEFTDALGNVEDRYIDEAVNYQMKETKNYNKGMKIWRIVAIAACACLALVLVINLADSGTFTSDYYYTGEEYETTAAARSKVSASGDYESGAVMYSTSNDLESYALYDEASEEVYSEDASEDVYYAAADGGAMVGGTDTETIANTDPAKIIYSVYMEMQTTQFDAASSSLESLITEYGGYVQNQYQTNPDQSSYRSYRYVSYTIRVPAEQLDAFVAALEGEGSASVTYLSKSADDVSESYYDVQGRLETAQAKLARLQELLAEAEDMADIVSIESAISDVEYQIDSYSGTLRYYDSQVDYSTVTVGLSEVAEIEEPEAPMSFGERLSNAFSNSFKSVGTFLKNLVIWLAASWIWLALIVVIVIVVVVIVKHKRKKTDK